MYFLLLLVILMIGNDTLNSEVSVKKSVIILEISAPKDSAGGLIAADVNDDGDYDLLITAPGYVGAYATNGNRIWSKQINIRVGNSSESHGLPGHHGPGIQAGDINGDGKTEVLFFDQDIFLNCQQHLI